jgi:hypothetical protein
LILWGPIPIGLGAETDPFCAAKAAEGASPRTVEWYRMILIRAVRRFGEARPVDTVPAAQLRAWLLELRGSLAPESIAGYVRGLKDFGNWCAAEEAAAAASAGRSRAAAATDLTSARRGLNSAIDMPARLAAQVRRDSPRGAAVGLRPRRAVSE